MNNEKGMTLVELMAVVSIISIIGMAGVQFLLSTTEIFDRQVIANEQTIIVDHVRQAITSEVRYVEAMALDNDEHADVDKYVGYATIWSTGNNLKLKEELADGSTTTTDLISSEIMGKHTMSVEFEKVSSTNDVLQVNVFLDEGTESSVELSFSIRLLNMALYENEIDEETDEQGTVTGINAITRIYFHDEVELTSP